jgi:hypothetical protein
MLLQVFVFRLIIRRGPPRDIPGLPVRVRTCLRAPHRQAQTGSHKATRLTWRLSTGYPTLQRRVNPPEARKPCPVPEVLFE